MNSISDRLRSWLFFKEIEYQKSLNDATELMHDPEFYLDVKNVVRRLQKLEAENKKLRECIKFYATFMPHQFPEGYYEICIEKGVGGHNRFGTIARQTLKEIDNE